MGTLTWPSPTQLKNMLDPTSDQDGATKHYVDFAISGGGGSGIGAAGANTDIQYNAGGTISASSGLTFDYVGNVLTLTGNIITNNANLGNLANANYYFGNGYNLTGIQASSGAANTVIDNAQPNITSTGNLVSLQIGNITSGSGGSNGIVYFDGNGDANFSNTITANSGNFVTLLVGNTLSNVYIDNSGDINAAGNLNLVGGKIQGSNTVTSNYFIGKFDSTSSNQPNITNVGILSKLQVGSNVYIDATGDITISGNISISGTPTVNNKSIPSYITSATKPTDPNYGDQWFVPSTGILYQYIYDGTDAYWIDQTSGYISSNTQAQAGTLVLRDQNGSIYANYYFGDGGQLSNIGTGAVTGLSSIIDFTSNSITANNVTISPGVLTIGNNTSNGNIIIANSSITVNPINNSADILSPNIANITIGTNANVTLGSTTGNVIVQGNLVANNFAVSSLTGDKTISSKSGTGIGVDTLIDTFDMTLFRTAKYIIKAGSQLGYESLEVLLVHDDTHSYISVYGMVSSINEEIITLSSDVTLTGVATGNVNLYASGVAGGTTINVLGTYIKD